MLPGSILVSIDPLITYSKQLIEFVEVHVLILILVSVPYKKAQTILMTILILIYFLFFFLLFCTHHL